ncbi:MAG: hypothetical protein AAF456_13305 [Planctomycetota bacterium]
MATNTQISHEDLIFRYCSGPNAGQTIPVSSRKCLLQDNSQGNSAIAVLRGAQGVSARSTRGENQLNGNPLDVEWLTNGDRLTFGNNELEVVQTGVFGNNETVDSGGTTGLGETADAFSQPEAYQAETNETALAGEGEFTPPSTAEFSTPEFPTPEYQSESETAQTLDHPTDQSANYSYEQQPQGQFDNQDQYDNGISSEIEHHFHSETPYRQFDQMVDQAYNSGENDGGYTEYPQNNEFEPNHHQSQDQQNDFGGNEAAENEFSLTPEAGAWQDAPVEPQHEETYEDSAENGAAESLEGQFNQQPFETATQIEFAERSGSFEETGYSPEPLATDEHSPQSAQTIHDWQGTVGHDDTDAQAGAAFAQNFDEWTGKLTAMEAGFEELRDQQASAEDRFDSLQEQLEMLTGSVAQLMETLTSSSFLQQQDTQSENAFDSTPAPEQSTWQEEPSSSIENFGQDIAEGNQPFAAEEQQETSPEFTEQFNSLFNASENAEDGFQTTKYSEQEPQDDAHYQAIAETEHEEVFEVESTAVDSSEDVNARLNSMFSNLENHTAENTHEEASGLSSGSLMESMTQQPETESYSSEDEDTQTASDGAPSQEEAESVAAVLARMQAKGTLPETAFEDDAGSDAGAEPVPVFEATAPSYEPEQPAAPSTGNEEEGDSSVQDYMNRLLGRVSSGSAETGAEPVAATGTSPVAGSLNKTGGAEPVKLLSPDEYKPSHQAPERTANMDAMRELANMQAEAALNHSDNTKRQKAIILTSGSLTGLAMAGGCYLLTTSTGLTSMPFILAVVAFGFAAFCGYRTWMSFQKLTGSSKSRKQKAAAQLQETEALPKQQTGAGLAERTSSTQNMLQRAIAKAQQQGPTE